MPILREKVINEPVANLAAIQAINDSVASNGIIVNVTDLGLYKLDKSSTSTIDNNLVIATNSGIGRWIKIANSQEESIALQQNHIYIGDASNKAAPSVYTTIDESIDDQILIETSKGTGVQLKVTGDSIINQDVSTTANVEFNSATLTQVSSYTSHPALFTANDLVDKKYVDDATSLISSSLETNKAWIDQTLGNDLTGVVGNMGKPFATYNGAASGITGVNTNRYLMHYSPGQHSETTLVLKPYIFAGGDSIQTTRVAVSSGSVTVSPLLSTNNSRTGFHNFYLSGTTGINFDLRSLPGYTGSQSAVFDLKDVWVNGTFNFTGRTFGGNPGGADEVDIWGGVYFGAITVDGGTFNSNNAILQGGLTLNATIANTNSSIVGGSISGLTISAGTLGITNNVTLTSCSVSGTLTIDGLYSILNTDEISLAGVTSIVYTGGATSAQLILTSNSSNIKNNSTVPGRTITNALDNLKGEVQDILIVTRFGNDLAELNYPTGSGAGFISVSSDFPASFVQNDCYMIPDGVTVTDNNPSKTNTGLTFTGPIQISADAVNNTWISRDGKSVNRALCTIGAALYINLFAVTRPPIWCLDGATYYFPQYTSSYGDVFAPFANVQMTGIYYLFDNSRNYYNNVEIIASFGGAGGILKPGFNGDCTFQAKKVFSNDASLSSGLFTNAGTGNRLLTIYADELLCQSSTRNALQAQGNGGDSSRINAIINGKIKGRAIVYNSGNNLITIYAGDKSELTTIETSGNVIVNANLDDVPSLWTDTITVSSNGQTSFPAALTYSPKSRTVGAGLQILDVTVNGQVYGQYTTDFVVGGTGNKDFTWNNAYSLQITDTVIIRYMA